MVFLLLGLGLALLFAAFTDIRRRQIDNWLTASIAVTAPLFWWASSLGWIAIGWQTGLALGSFALLCLPFALRMMGGGDVKLLSALALWIRPAWFADLLVIMALVGGVLTIGSVFWHVTRRQRDRIAIPYGVAIAAAGLWIVTVDYLPGL
ncbi:MAG: prepilin peptidase [Pseudomonadota bacterium]|nr:prepilin peptidase [Pseudomonadota bacterium]